MGHPIVTRIGDGASSDDQRKGRKIETTMPAENTEWDLRHTRSSNPQPVKGVQIPKPNGGMRQLGIPTVIDRLIQQAILQVLDPIFDPTFSEHSYGFRVGRNAHQAIEKAAEYVAEGRYIVVDIDIEKFFDRVIPFVKNKVIN